MKKWIVSLVIGVALVLIGTGAGVNGDTIKCGSETMLPGDTCEESRGGSTVDTRTYAEMKADKEAGQRTFDSWGRWAFLGGGVALAVLGIGGIVATRRKRAAAGPTTADLHLARQHAAQQPGYPQQPVSGQLNQFAPAPQGPAVGRPTGGYPQHGVQHPGYRPGPAAPRGPGQPVAPYRQGATPPPRQAYDFGPGSGNHE
jgi:hypothetical protein